MTGGAHDDLAREAERRNHDSRSPLAKAVDGANDHELMNVLLEVGLAEPDVVFMDRRALEIAVLESAPASQLLLRDDEL